MMGMIRGADSISKIFSFFHDGVVTAHKTVSGDLHLEIQIAYLAQRVHPDYRCFHIALRDIEHLSFTTWPKQTGAAPATLLACEDIFTPALGILHGGHIGELIEVVCNQPSAGCAHCGGELFFSASAATVADEAGREFDIDALGQLCAAYWEEWTSRKHPC